jgi:hypothetical protein
VEVHPKIKKPHEPKAKKAVMREKESRRFAKSGGSDVRDVEKKWQDLGKKVALPTDLKVSQMKRFEWSPETQAGLIWNAPERVKFGAGKFGSSLVFDGQQMAKVEIPNWSQERARTVALWVKIPADAPMAEAPPILSWRHQGKGVGLVELGLNDDPSHGVVGAATVRLGNRKVVMTKPLRDGQWHHVALLLVRQPKEGGGMDVHPRVFVNGKQEGRSGKGVVRNPRQKNAPPLVPGLWLAGGIDDENGEHFVGEVDGLTLADGGMTPAEIRQLMTSAHTW